MHTLSDRVAPETMIIHLYIEPAVRISHQGYVLSNNLESHRDHIEMKNREYGE